MMRLIGLPGGIPLMLESDGFVNSHHDLPLVQVVLDSCRPQWIKRAQSHRCSVKESVFLELTEVACKRKDFLNQVRGTSDSHPLR